MKIKITGQGYTSKRSAKRMLARGTARYVSEREVAMVADDPRVKCSPPPRTSTFWGPSFEVKAAPVCITDAFPGMPVLPIIGYRRGMAA